MSTASLKLAFFVMCFKHTLEWKWSNPLLESFSSFCNISAGQVCHQEHKHHDIKVPALLQQDVKTLKMSWDTSPSSLNACPASAADLLCYPLGSLRICGCKLSYVPVLGQSASQLLTVKCDPRGRARKCITGLSSWIWTVKFPRTKQLIE